METYVSEGGISGDFALVSGAGDRMGSVFRAVSAHSVTQRLSTPQRACPC